MNLSGSQGDADRASTEVAFLAKDLTYKGFIHDYKLNGKFIIPSIIPLMKSSKIVETTESPKVTSKATGVSYSGKLKKVNYITISIPRSIVWGFVNRSTVKQFTLNPKDTNMYIELHIPKNTEFMVNFVGDDINKIRIVSVNDRGVTNSGGVSGS